ncbi:hypothetical protein TCA2_4516 [Paenibacillus sp. TCA20]|uniref:hypothetical protein n=1 Tax=Paenibacillus sp. TCA20 TaxID=1499968 RepID=UPI0004D7C59F|nr:hypothetical protein [Paenibacillus sp. TCA20]GAK42024.1 hypothetical protein TCA2_4516 [Paenibacillus sp. TCA20]
MANMTTQALPPASGDGGVKQFRKEGKIARTFGAGMVAVDAFSRIKDGENAAVAIGKAALTNAAWNLMPGGFLTMGVMAGVSMTPEIIRMTDAAKAGIRQKSSMFGGGFTQNEGQMYMQQTGMQNASNARNTASAIMSRHARGASKAY